MTNMKMTETKETKEVVEVADEKTEVEAIPTSVNSLIRISKSFDNSFEIHVSSSVCSLNSLRELVGKLKKEFIDSPKEKGSKIPLGIG